MSFDAESLFLFFNVLCYNHTTILTHSRCEVYVTVVEELSGIDVDVLQLRTKKQLFFNTILRNYVVDLSLPSTFVVTHET